MTDAAAPATVAETIEKDRKAFAIVRRAANLPEDTWADDRLRAIRATVTPEKATLAQFAIFMATAAKYNLDPLVGELWLADQNGKMLVLTGRNTFLKVANSQRDYRGLSAGVVYEKDEFEARRHGDRVLVKHVITGFNRGKLIGSWCVVRVEGKADIYIQREMAKFQHLVNKDNWKRYPDDMIENRAIVAALRRAYNLAGILERSEADDAVIEGSAVAATGSEAERAKAGTLSNAADLRSRLEAARQPVADAKPEPEAAQGAAADLTDAELEPDHPDAVDAEQPAGPSLELVAEDDDEALDAETLRRDAENERGGKGPPREPGED